MNQKRLKECVEQWPDCQTGEYNPACCRFPKSCSATIYDETTINPELLEETETMRYKSYKFYIQTINGITTKIYGDHTALNEIIAERDLHMAMTYVTGVRITNIETERLSWDNPVREVVLDEVGSYFEEVHNVEKAPPVRSCWVWENGNPEAEELIVVTKVEWLEINAEYMITTARIDGKDFTSGVHFVSHTPDRFWEAVTPYIPAEY